MPSIEGVCGCRFVGTTRTEEKNRRNKRSDEKWDYYKKKNKDKNSSKEQRQEEEGKYEREAPGRRKILEGRKAKAKIPEGVQR